MATTTPAPTLHLVALDVEAASCVCALPRADQWEIRNWDKVEDFLVWVTSDEADAPRIRLVVAAATADEVDVRRLRELQVLPRRIDVLAVVRVMSPEEHRDLLKTGIGRVERIPLPPMRPEVLFNDRSFLATLFPGTLEGTRHETLEFELASQRENVTALVRLLCERCDEMGHPNDFVRSQFPLVLDEAVTNAMEHGNGWDATRTVSIRAALSAEGVRVEITDQGEGFDRDLVHDPLSEERRGHVGGRGLFLMESIMDDVHYEDGGRTVVLAKRIGAPAPVA